MMQGLPQWGVARTRGFAVPRFAGTQGFEMTQVGSVLGLVQCPWELRLGTTVGHA